MSAFLLKSVFFAYLFAVYSTGAETLHRLSESGEYHDSRSHKLDTNRFKQSTKFKHTESAKLSYRPEITEKSRVQPEVLHRVVIVRKQNNINKLEKILLDVSDPASANYGNHLSKESIATLTANPEAVESIKDFLVTNNIHDWNASRYDDYISAVGPVHVWERLFDTQFYEFEHASLPGKRFVRCLKYSVPEHLSDHIEGVLNTVQFPDHHVGKRLQLTKHTDKDVQATDTVTPALLNQVYSIANNTGNHLTNQAVYAILDQTFSPSDLTTFQNLFNLPQESIPANVGGHVANNACASDINDCIEANLDVQYMMAVAQNVPTTYYYWTGSDVWLDWIESVADLANPPDVFSISYGSYEAAFSATYLQAFNVEAMKLGVAGTTVLVASGDDGVAGFLVRAGRLSCDYYASFPASSPYVTAVGGTMGPESGTAEIACQSSLGSQITTGGGFSHLYTLPSWQTSVVNGYFARVKGTSKAPKSGYDPTKRGYPDISALANRYQVVANGIFYVVSGTSASSPVVAGMVSLVNSARRAAGNSTLGWLNPALYAYGPLFVNDITSGDNKCLSAGASCCSQGFYATTGWDPVTGLGSIDFAQFLRTFTTLRAAEVPASNPTVARDDQAWVLMDGYGVSGCPTKKHDVLAQSGYPVGVCLIQYDNATRPVSSLRYACDSDLGYATTWYFSDLECSIASFADFEERDLGCVEITADTSIARSVNLFCATGTDTALPLPAGKHLVERAFNDPSQCRLNSTAYFHSWRTEYCFATGDSSSFMMTEAGQEMSYNDTQCSSSSLVETVTLSTACEAAATNSTDDEDVFTALRVTYAVFDVPEESKNKGLSSAAIGGIVSGTVLLFLTLCCCCACFTFCRGRVRTSVGPTMHAHQSAPVMTTAAVAQVAVPMYEMHYVQVAATATTTNNASAGINKYQPVPV